MRPNCELNQIESKLFLRRIRQCYYKYDNDDGDDDVGNVSQGTWSGVNLSLCAVNLGNVAGHTLSADKLAEICVLMAMTIRLYLPKPFHFLVVSRVILFGRIFTGSSLLGSDTYTFH